MFLNSALLPHGVHTTSPFQNFQHRGYHSRCWTTVAPKMLSLRLLRQETLKSHTIFCKTGHICGKHPFKPLTFSSQGLETVWQELGAWSLSTFSPVRILRVR